jgi:hypothetical protein
MKPNAIKIGYLTIGLVFLLGTLAWAGGPTRGRHAHQQREIYSGVRSGNISPHEYSRLTREQYRIQDYRNRALSDGRLNRHEARRLDRMQDRAGRHIYQSYHYGPMVPRPWGPAEHTYGRYQGSAYRPHFSGGGRCADGNRFTAPIRQPGFSFSGSVWGRR